MFLYFLLARWVRLSPAFIHTDKPVLIHDRMACEPWPEGRKLVHLDLKGAPPRAQYLHQVRPVPSPGKTRWDHICFSSAVELRCVFPLQLIELFSELGADGLLVEYEDMFPYEGDLQLLQASTHPAYRYTNTKHAVLLDSVVFFLTCWKLKAPI